MSNKALAAAGASQDTLVARNAVASRAHWPLDGSVTPVTSAMANAYIGSGHADHYALYISFNRLIPGARSIFDFQKELHISVAQHTLMYLFLANMFRRQSPDFSDHSYTTLIITNEYHPNDDSRVIGVLLNMFETQIPEPPAPMINDMAAQQKNRDPEKDVRERRRLPFPEWLAKGMSLGFENLRELHIPQNGSVKPGCALSPQDIQTWLPLIFGLRSMSQMANILGAYHYDHTFQYRHRDLASPRIDDTGNVFHPSRQFSVESAASVRMREIGLTPFTVEVRDGRRIKVMRTLPEIIRMWSRMPGGAWEPHATSYRVESRMYNPDVMKCFMMPHIQRVVDTQSIHYTLSLAEWKGQGKPESEFNEWWKTSVHSRQDERLNIEQFRTMSRGLIKTASKLELPKVRASLLNQFENVWAPSHGVGNQEAMLEAGSYPAYIRFGAKVQLEHGNYCSWGGLTNPNRDIFQALQKATMVAAELFFRMATTHRLIPLYYAMIIDATRDDGNDRSILNVNGPPGTGKSYGTQVIIDMSVPGTIHETSYQTAKSSTGSSKPATFDIHDETKNSGLGATDATRYQLYLTGIGQLTVPETGDNLGIFKQTSTKRKTVTDGLVLDGAQRFSTSQEIIQFGSTVYLTNVLKEQFPLSLVSRILFLYIGKDETGNMRIASMRNKPDNQEQVDAAKDRFINSRRLMSYVACVYNTLCACLLVPDVENSVSNIVAGMLAQNMINRGVIPPDSRRTLQVSTFARAYSVERSVALVTTMGLGGMDPSKPFQLSDINKVVPTMYATRGIVAHVSEALEMFYNELEARVLDVMRIVFAPCMTPEHEKEARATNCKTNNELEKYHQNLHAQGKGIQMNRHKDDPFRDRVVFYNPITDRYSCIETKLKFDRNNKVPHEFNVLSDLSQCIFGMIESPIPDESAIFVTICGLTRKRIREPGSGKAERSPLVVEGTNWHIDAGFLKYLRGDIVYEVLQSIYHESPEFEEFTRGKLDKDEKGRPIYHQFASGYIGDPRFAKYEFPTAADPSCIKYTNDLPAFVQHEQAKRHDPKVDTEVDPKRSSSFIQLVKEPMRSGPHSVDNFDESKSGENSDGKGDKDAKDEKEEKEFMRFMDQLDESVRKEVDANRNRPRELMRPPESNTHAIVSASSSASSSSSSSSSKFAAAPAPSALQRCNSSSTSFEVTMTAFPDTGVTKYSDLEEMQRLGSIKLREMKSFKTDRSTSAYKRLEVQSITDEHAARRHLAKCGIKPEDMDTHYAIPRNLRQCTYAHYMAKEHCNNLAKLLIEFAPQSGEEGATSEVNRQVSSARTLLAQKVLVCAAMACTSIATMFTVYKCYQSLPQGVSLGWIEWFLRNSEVDMRIEKEDCLAMPLFSYVQMCIRAPQYSSENLQRIQLQITRCWKELIAVIEKYVLIIYPDVYPQSPGARGSNSNLDGKHSAPASASSSSSAATASPARYLVRSAMDQCMIDVGALLRRHSAKHKPAPDVAGAASASSSSSSSSSASASASASSSSSSSDLSRDIDFGHFNSTLSSSQPKSSQDRKSAATPPSSPQRNNAEEEQKQKEQEDQARVKETQDRLAALLSSSTGLIRAKQQRKPTVLAVAVPPAAAAAAPVAPRVSRVVAVSSPVSVPAPAQQPAAAPSPGEEEEEEPAPDQEGEGESDNKEENDDDDDDVKEGEAEQEEPAVEEVEKKKKKKRKRSKYVQDQASGDDGSDSDEESGSEEDEYEDEGLDKDIRFEKGAESERSLQDIQARFNAAEMENEMDEATKMALRLMTPEEQTKFLVKERRKAQKAKERENKKRTVKRLRRQE